MKLLAIFILLASISVQGQTKKDTVRNENYLSGVSFSKSGSEITVWSNGRITISGDSVQAIKLLWSRLAEANRMEHSISVTWRVDTTYCRLPNFEKLLKENK